MRLFISFLLVVWAMIQFSYAQDNRLSQYYTSPLSLNPAYTGVFNGALRIASNYRNQYQNLGDASNNINASIDGSYRKLGMGAFINTFRAGLSTDNTVLLSTSYRIQLTERYFVSLGIQGGMIQRLIDQQDIRLGDPTEVLDSYSSYNPDFNAGILFFDAGYDQIINVFAAGAVYHLISAQNTFTAEADKESFLFGKYVANVGVQVNLTDRIDFTPQVYFLRQGNASDVNIGALAHYNLIDESNSLLGGVSYRIGNAALLTVGVELIDFTFGVSYDLNVGPITSSTRRPGEGFEFSIIYVKPVKRGVRSYYCPNI